jgi:hypothetical protein
VTGYQPPHAGVGDPALVPGFLVLDFFFGDRFLRADFLVLAFFLGDFFAAFLAAFFFAAIWCGSFRVSARITVRPSPGRYQAGRDNTAGIVSRIGQLRQGESAELTGARNPRGFHRSLDAQLSIVR